MQGIGISTLRNVLIVIGVFIVCYFLNTALVANLLTDGSSVLESLTDRFYYQDGNNVDELERDPVAYEEASSKAYALVSLCIKMLLVLVFLVLSALMIRLSKPSQNSERPHNYKIVALVLSSVLFGLIHSANPEIEKFGYGIMMVYYISAGMLLGIVTLMDNRIELALGIHAATNFTGAVFVGYDGAAIQTDSILTSHSLNPYLMTGGFFVLAGVFLFFAKRKYGWGSFSQLLDPIYKPDEDQDLGHLLVDLDQNQ